MALAQFRSYRFSANGENDSPKSVSRSWASEGVYSGHFFPSHIGLVVSWGALRVSGFLSRRMMGDDSVSGVKNVSDEYGVKPTRLVVFKVLSFGN